MEYVIILLVDGIICGIICSVIASNRKMEGGFWWGFFLSIIGIIIVALRPNDNKAENAANNTNTNSISEHDIINNIKEYKELYDTGVISEEEFVKKKEQLLSKSESLGPSTKEAEKGRRIENSEYEKLLKMKEQGIISDVEFEKLKYQ